MKKVFFLIFGFYCLSAEAQSYTSYLTGNTENIDVQPQFGLCLMGGAGENDPAMTWFLERANGGDVVVLRASGSDGYNEYMYSELGVTVNSVETIVFNSAEASSDPYVIDKLNNAEAIWMAGGDQGDYVNYWQGTAVEDAINNLMNVKQGPVGGISAGMAIMGQAYFSALVGTINSETALENPFSPAMTIGYNDFLEAPFMEGVITETHFNDPDRIRYGRVVAFMARLQYNEGIRPLGMASNEYCAIAIDENGLARAFGDFPEFDDDFVYFLQPNCEGEETPEIIEEGSPLTWNRNNEAVKVYKVPATPSGENYFDLNTWTAGEGGEWENWYVINGELTREPATSVPDCLLDIEKIESPILNLYPNPAQDQITLVVGRQGELRVFDASGRLLHAVKVQEGNNIVNLEHLEQGWYNLQFTSENSGYSVPFILTR